MVIWNNYLIIAHYHQNGQLRSDLVNLIKLFHNDFKNIIVISTNLKNIEIKKIKKYATIITRENLGYDFYSYKVGIDYLKKKLKKKFYDKNKILLLPSSLLFLKPKKLLINFRKINDL